MKWLLNALASSVGRKFVMAITGLLLCGFLVVHLAGNLLLLAGAEAYNDYAHKLHSQGPLLAVAETGLFALFIIHIVLAFKLTVGNKLARGQSYAIQNPKGEGDGFGFGRPDTWMAVSGAVVLGYIVLHLIDFKLQLRSDIAYEGLTPFDKALAILKTPLSAIGYLAGFVFLGLHLMHGVPSLFQTLGINHKKYNNLIRIGGLLFVIGLVVGNAVLVGWANTRPAEPKAILTPIEDRSAIPAMDPPAAETSDGAAKPAKHTEGDKPAEAAAEKPAP